MASKTPLAKRARSAPPGVGEEMAKRARSAPPGVGEETSPRVGWTNPLSSFQGCSVPIASYVLPSMLKPRKDIVAAMPTRTPPASFVLFMLDFMKSNECASVVFKAAEDGWNSMSEAEKGPYESKALEARAALSKAVESYETMMNARKEIPAAAPPTEEKLS